MQLEDIYTVGHKKRATFIEHLTFTR